MPMKDRYKLGLRGKTTLLLGSLICAVLIIIGLTNYRQSQNAIELKVMELEQSKLLLLKHEIENSLSNHNRNLLSLHDVPPIQAIIRARANNGIDPHSGDSLQEWNNRLTTIFMAFLKNHAEYQQIRYIDADGNEMIRVQSGVDGKAIAITDDQLQNKSGSPYVGETLKLKPGQTYFSDVNLNREHGVIQLPHLPVLRMATPVHGPDQRAVALIIINLATEQMFKDVRNEARGGQRNIVNEKGYYIKHADPSKTFGFDRGIDYRLQNTDPELAAIALHQDQLIRRHDAQHELDGFQKVYFSPQDKDRYWLLTLHIPKEAIFSDISASLNRVLSVSLLIGLLSLALIVWFVSRKILTPVVELADAANRLQNGDLTVRVDAASTRDEFHTLYSALNAFAENQQKSTLLLKNRVSSQTKRLTAVIDNVVDGIITIGERGAIESFNPAARRIFGYSDAEVIGHNVKMLMPEPYHSEHDGYLVNYISTGEKKIIGIGREVTGQRKDGSTFPMELAVSDIIVDGVRHFVGITRDITERKRHEQMQREFISTVSHELRTPLTSIRGSLGLILGGVAGELPEKAKSLLTIANNNSERLINLINDILDIEKITAGKMQFEYSITNLVTVVQQAIEANKGYADQLHIRFELMTGFDREILVRVDKNRMAQVMSNLLSNAAKYSPTNDRVEISLTTAEDKVRISVHDHGKGIPEEFKPRIFNKFAQADSSDTRQKGGTGLGLNITQAIVERQNGNIGFDSSEQSGTTFYVDLPIWSEQQEYTPGGTKNPSDAPLLLIIEDDHDVSRLISIMLQNEGYRFHQAFSYQQALEQINNNQYDAVTLDLMLPGGSGLSILQQLRENEATINLPVIVVSAKAKEGRLEFKGDAFSMVDWIEKPIDQTRLLESIRSGLAQAVAKSGRLLHVEDDPDIAMIVDTLLGNECEVIHATTLKQAKNLLIEDGFDLVLLDIGLPDGSGLDLLPDINNQQHPTPVIIFSAQDVPQEIATQVQGTLVKSKTDNETLMQLIKSTLTK